MENSDSLIMKWLNFIKDQFNSEGILSNDLHDDTKAQIFSYACKLACTARAFLNDHTGEEIHAVTGDGDSQHGCQLLNLETLCARDLASTEQSMIEGHLKNCPAELEKLEPYAQAFEYGTTNSSCDLPSTQD